MTRRLTYGMLLEQLQTLSPDQLKLDVVAVMFDGVHLLSARADDFDIVGEDNDRGGDVRPYWLDRGIPYIICNR